MRVMVAILAGVLLALAVALGEQGGPGIRDVAGCLVGVLAR